ncbi:MAG: 4Fe-4S binding protein [bacterium]|nr:4Fe-4S binding protein [bacterium]
MLLAICAALGLSALWGYIIAEDKVALSDEDIRIFAGTTMSPEERQSPFRHWVIEESEGRYYGFTSGDAGVEVTGYGGPIEVLILMDDGGYIEKTELLANYETPSYLADIDLLFEQFIGRSVEEPLTIDEDIDAITRATVTSVAVTDATRLATRRAAVELLGMDLPTEGKPEPEVDWLGAVFAGTFLIVGVILRKHPIKWLRFAFLLSAVVILGFWMGRFIGIGDIGRFFLFGFPGLLQGLSIYVLIFGGIIVASVWGNVYCGWVCPFGAISELLYSIPGAKLDITGSLTRRLSFLRYAVLVVVLSLIIGSRELWAADYEPFDQMFAFVGGFVAISFAIFLLALSIFNYRFFCKYLCAVGGLLGAFVWAGLRRGTPPTGTACCKMGALGGGDTEIDAGLCIQCGDCRVVRHYEPPTSGAS